MRPSAPLRRRTARGRLAAALGAGCVGFVASAKAEDSRILTEQEVYGAILNFAIRREACRLGAALCAPTPAGIGKSPSAAAPHTETPDGHANANETGSDDAPAPTRSPEQTPST